MSKKSTDRILRKSVELLHLRIKYSYFPFHSSLKFKLVLHNKSMFRKINSAEKGADVTNAIIVQSAGENIQPVLCIDGLSPKYLDGNPAMSTTYLIEKLDALITMSLRAKRNKKAIADLSKRLGIICDILRELREFTSDFTPMQRVALNSLRVIVFEESMQDFIENNQKAGNIVTFIMKMMGSSDDLVHLNHYNCRLDMFDKEFHLAFGQDIRKPTEQIKTCGHVCSLALTLDQCCACMDKRPVLPEGTYPIYVDGAGWKKKGRRNAHYCPVCSS